jgi:hypothetical protein
MPILLQNLDSPDFVSQGEYTVAFEKDPNWPSRSKEIASVVG